MEKIVTVITLLCISACSLENRKAIILMDSGINITPEIKPYLCHSGHKSFIQQDDNPLSDTTGHGTVMVKTMMKKMNPEKYCIISYKFFPGYPAPEAYAQALFNLKGTNAVAVVLALEDTSHYLDEAKWFREIVKYKKVFVSAGNSGINLSKNCKVYPACLSSEINSKNFVVVGSKTPNFNQGGPINMVAESEIEIDKTIYRGTSISSALAVGEYITSYP